MKKSLIKRITALMLSVLIVFAICACGNNQTATSSSSSTTKSSTADSATTDSSVTESSTTEDSTTSDDSSTTTDFPENGATEIVCVDKKVYFSLEVIEPISAAYYENQSEILLIEINTAFEEIINGFLLGMDNIGASVTIEETDTTITLTRETGDYCEIDFVEDTIYFSDFDSFNTRGYKDNPFDVLSSAYLNEEGESIFFQRESSIYTPGYGILIDLAERNIPLDIYEGKKYIPFQTFNDLFITPHGMNFAYNGEDVFFLVGNSLSPELEELYYHDEPSERSDALAEYTYNELCLFFDLYYGLQAEHSFTMGFDGYFEKIGLKEQLLSSDSVDVFAAIGELTYGYIADSHSGPAGASPYAGEKLPDDIQFTIAHLIKVSIQLAQELEMMRDEMLGDVKFYEKVGNTAFITFDNFTLEDRSDGYGEEALQLDDTLTIIMYAHAQIMQDEEIENVVVDLSCNSGGAVDACVYLVAWMLGYCDVSVYNSITESCATTTYKADVNMDGIFDSNDTIADKNLYCIVSPVSFSCGNYAPALLKASGKVTIVGKTSGGGACVVCPAVAADGTFFSISSAMQLSSVINGSYYHVDTGVVPDVSLTKYESIYDREGLAEYLNSLK